MRATSMCLAVIACAVVAAPAGAQTPPPAALAPLLQQMSALHITSERFSVQTSATGVDSKTARALAASGISGETTTTAPWRAQLTMSIFGTRVLVRQVGARLYLYEPAIAGRDGGRPWVEIAVRSFPQLLGISKKLPDMNVATSSVAGPALVARQLAQATNVRQGAAEVLDGQACTPFAGSLDPSLLTAATPDGPFLPGGAMPTLSVCIAADGLPVQTAISLTLGPITVTATTDILAVDFPVDVSPPPRAQTITFKRLRALLARRKHPRHR